MLASRLGERQETPTTTSALVSIPLILTPRLPTTSSLTVSPAASHLSLTSPASPPLACPACPFCRPTPPALESSGKSVPQPCQFCQPPSPATGTARSHLLRSTPLARPHLWGNNIMGVQQPQASVSALAWLMCAQYSPRPENAFPDISCTVSTFFHAILGIYKH